MRDRNDKRFFDFMCSCSDAGRERCEKTYEEVRDSLMAESSGWRGNENPDQLFTSLVIFGLDGMKNGMARIAGIDTDMWSGIAIDYQYDYKGDDFCECDKGDDCECDEWSHQDFWIECDLIHHGLARAYQLVKEFDESLTKES